jgi:hypothetical protein
MYISGSKFMLKNSEITQFNSTLVEALRSNVTISDVYVEDGGYYGEWSSSLSIFGGLLKGSEWPSVLIEELRAYNVHASSGGVVYVEGNQDNEFVMK